MERQACFRPLTPSLDISPSGLIYFSQNLIKLKVFCGDCIFEQLEQILLHTEFSQKILVAIVSPAVLNGDVEFYDTTSPAHDLLLNLGLLNLVILLKLYFLENSGYNYPPYVFISPLSS